MSRRPGSAGGAPAVNDHRPKVTRPSKPSGPRKPIFRRGGVGGVARSDGFGGSGAPSLRLLALALVFAAAFIALVASPASAKETQVFTDSFASAGTGNGRLALAAHSGLAINSETASSGDTRRVSAAASCINTLTRARIWFPRSDSRVASSAPFLSNSEYSS